MKEISQSKIIILVTFSILFFDSPTVQSQEPKIDGHFLVGEVVVPLGDGTLSHFILHVQRHQVNPRAKRDIEKWSNEPLILEDGRDPVQVFTDVKAKWQTFYQDMVSQGMPLSEVQQMLNGITSDHERAGVWVLTGLNANGYTGASREISIGPNTGLSTIAHESMHGWHWGACEDPKSDVDGILFQDLFTTWANFVYHTRKNKPEKLKGEINGEPWVLDYLNYGLQNDAEWLANTFAGWLYAPEKSRGQNWLAMKKSAPDFQKFFRFLWEEGLSVQESYRKTFGPIQIKHPQYHPTEGVPAVEGFTKEDSEAIWKVCTDAPDKEAYVAHFDSIIRTIAPDLPGSPAEHYSLGYGDANHDGTTDWIATYTGPGPRGLGNGKYLWNGENKVGTYTFIVSGKKNDTYAEYKQDPYSTLPSMNNGALAQPWYREWQGKYGSCNGASLFSYRTQEWIDEYLKDLGKTINFRFSPPEWQTAICLPDDPHKSLVDRSGELLYHYQQGGREFGTRISVQIGESARWIKQELYSPRVPIVRTYHRVDDLEITEEAFADTEVRPVKSPDKILERTDDGSFLQNWANPSTRLDPSLRNIAVHMNGNIHYELTVPSGASRCIALALCEGYWSEVGKRIQILSVEGAEPVTVDAVADIGQNMAASFWFDAKDSNGDGKITISVEAAAKGSDKNTILNGLWVFDADTRHDSEALISGKLNTIASSDLTQANYGGPGRDDIILVRVENSGNEEHIFNPKLIVNTVLPLSFHVDKQEAVINNWETVRSSLKMIDIVEDTDKQYVIQLESLMIPAGKTVSFFVQYSNGTPRDKDKEHDLRTVKQVLACQKDAVDFWENNTVVPFNRVQLPDPGVQALIESSIRNIWQAREIKKGLPAFQVGPTCYRGLWIVDGAFLLEAAAMLGAGDQARNGVAYELTTQKPDGRIESLTPDFWKENGIVLWTCIRHAQLTQDKIWLESVWPRLQLIAEYIKILRQQTLENNSPLDDGLHPAGTLDGGIGGTHDEYTNTYWNLTGLKAFILAAHWLGKDEEAKEWQKEYDDFMLAFQNAAKRDLSKDSNGNIYLPILLGEAGKNQLPQRAQWAFCHAVYPGQIFSDDDVLVAGNMAMLEDTEREGMVYGTGWDATGIWNYFASFYGHAWLWQGEGQKAAKSLYAFGNHAAPTLVWREEQSLKGEKFRKVGDMPHNWASAEFIRLAIHLLALDRGNELHLFEGLPREWTKPGMTTKLNGVATPFGALTMELKVAPDGQTASLNIEPLTDDSCEEIIVHLESWTKGQEEFIKLNPKEKNRLVIKIGAQD